MKKRILSIIMTAAMTVAVLSACQKNEGTQNGTTATEISTSAEVITSTETSLAADSKTAVTEPAGAEYETVTIQNGDRTVVFTEMPKAVVCANLYAAENMVMLGLEDKIAGKNIPANASEAPLPEVAEQFAQLKELERSFESVVEAEADLVIGQVSVFKDENWGSYEKLESQGINALTITGTLVQDETIEHVYEDILNLGKIFKIEDRAEALIEDIQLQIAAVREAVKDIPESDKVKVFVLDSFKGNEIYTTSSGLQSNLIELAGGINTTRNKADSRWFTTSIETLAEANPDIIIFNDYGSQTIAEKMDFVNSNPALADIPAVQNQNYLVMPLVAVMQDVRAASACRTFGEYFYPECFQD